MPFIPHTPNDIQNMLDTLGVKSIHDVFDEIPEAIHKTVLEPIPEGLNEMAINRLMQERQPKASMPCFIGAGSYAHHIPACVWSVAARGEFYTSYTPYQAEASQGSLQIIYEYQTMMANLMGMEVSNASLYDGASASAEAVLMALRIKKHTALRVLIPANLNIRYRQVLETILQHQDVLLEEIPFDKKTGVIHWNDLNRRDHNHLCALLINQPNFFGQLEAVDQLTDWAHQRQALVIAVVNPLAMAFLKEPGHWGKLGADIACGEGQPLGIPMAGGGPYFGFMCCRKAYLRQLPGRLVGRTHDAKGRVGYTLTLQAREQHIRRAKAKSNICTNQGLAITAAAIYMSVMGFEGLVQIAKVCHQKMHQLKTQLQLLPSVHIVFEGANFNEFAYQVEGYRAEQVLDALYQQGIQGGYALGRDVLFCQEAILVATTELITDNDIQTYVNAIAAMGH